MIQKKKNLFIILSIFSFQIFGQVIDDSILENITTEQIEQVKEAYETDKSSESEIFSNVEESTISLNANDSNIIEGRKYGYDFFSSMPTSLSAVGDLPLPNDYKISPRDQLTILSGAKDDVFDLNVKLDGTILFLLGL